jgi:iron complex outermembrane receptor protein
VIVLLAALVSPVAAAQSSVSEPVTGWDQRLHDADTTLRTLTPDDEAGRTQLAESIRALDTDISAWLETRGLTVAQPAAEGTRVADLSAALSRVRALLAQARAGATTADGTGVFYLGRVDVAVTASAPPGTSTIDDQQMRALDARTVNEALESTPGITLHRMGARNEGMVYLRGFDLRQVPILIDGIPVYVPYDGYVDLDRFVTDDLSEIRVTKGMTSVLIGPNALGGAINLITKRPTRPLEGLFNLSFGSGGEQAVDANVGVMRPGWYAHGTGSWLQSDDFPLSGDFAANALENGGARDNSSRRDAKASAKFGITPSGKGEYVVSYVLQRGQKDVPAYAGTNPAVKPRYWQWPDWNKDSVYVLTNTPLPRAQYLRGRAYYDRFYNELDSFDTASYSTMTRPSSFRSIYDDYTAGASVEYGTPLPGRQTLRAAGHFKQDIHRENNIGEPVRHFKNRTLSVGLEDTIAVASSVSVVAGIGADRQDTLQAEDFQNGVVSSFPLGDTGGVNPQAGIFIAAPHDGRARFTVSRKTRLPAIKDRYSYRMGSALPNPDLNAEQATTTEAGYDTALGRFSTLGLTAYYTAINDLVQPFYLQPNLFQLRNVGDVRNSGFEAEWRVRSIRHVQGSVGYSYLNRKNEPGTVVPLLNTPHNKFFGYVVYDGVPRLRLMGSVNYESSRQAQDDGAAFVLLPEYSNVSAKASYTVLTGLDLELAGSNLLDRNYQLYPGFPEAGRTVSANIRYRF